MLKRRLGEYRGRCCKANTHGRHMVNPIADHTGTASVVSGGMLALSSPRMRRHFRTGIAGAERPGVRGILLEPLRDIRLSRRQQG